MRKKRNWQFRVIRSISDTKRLENVIFKILTVCESVVKPCNSKSKVKSSRHPLSSIIVIKGVVIPSMMNHYLCHSWYLFVYALRPPWQSLPAGATPNYFIDDDEGDAYYVIERSNCHECISCERKVLQKC